MSQHQEHDLLDEVVGRVDDINPHVTVQPDVVRCAALERSPGHRDRNRLTRPRVGSALLDPGAALSLADSPLAAVGAALSHTGTDRLMAEILSGTDLDAELAKMLEGGE